MSSTAVVAAPATARPVLGRECLIELDYERQEDGVTCTGRFPGRVTKYQEELQECNTGFQIVKLYLVDFDDGEQRWMDLVQEKQNGRLWWITKDTDAFPDIQENEKTTSATTTTNTASNEATTTRNRDSHNHNPVIRGTDRKRQASRQRDGDDDRKPAAVTEASSRAENQQKIFRQAMESRRISSKFKKFIVELSSDDDGDDDDDFKVNNHIRECRHQVAMERPVDAFNAKRRLHGDRRENDNRRNFSGSRKPPPEAAAAAREHRPTSVVRDAGPVTPIVVTQAEGEPTRGEGDRNFQQEQQHGRPQEQAAKRHKKKHHNDDRRGGANVATALAASSVPVTPERSVPAAASSSQQQRRSHGSIAVDWLADMKVWLETVPHGRTQKVCSPKNASCVMRQVRKLASGEGISYKQWPDDVVFVRGTRVDLSSDLDWLLEESRSYERMHGKDLGNGWLLRHPIEKMKLFREYYWHNESS